MSPFTITLDGGCGLAARRWPPVSTLSGEILDLVEA